MAIELPPIDATPTKRIYHSIIADYDLPTAICELVDNALDAKAGEPVKVQIDIDTDQQSIKVTDFSGGVPESELGKLISPGESSMTGDEPSIGIFGVGSKRAVVALAQSIRITTRFQKNRTLMIQYDDQWIQKKDWNLPRHVVDNIDPSSTVVELSRLRFRIDPPDVVALRNRLETILRFFSER